MFFNQILKLRQIVLESHPGESDENVLGYLDRGMDVSGFFGKKI